MGRERVIMASQQDEILRGVIESVVQRPKFDATGRRKEVVVVSFTTPHEFTGTVTMPLSEWTDPDTRFKRVFEAVVDLEGPFWNPAEVAEESM